MRYMKPQTENFGQNLPSAIRQNLRKAGTEEGKCIEAREFVIALPESFVDYPPDGLFKIYDG